MASNNIYLHLDPAKDIGIIAPYHAQCQKILSILPRELEGTKVGSVEEFQGQVCVYLSGPSAGLIQGNQERRVIIISTVRSSTNFVGYDMQRTLGFVANPRRFNGNVYFRQLLLTALRISLFCSRRYARQVTSYRCRESRYAVP